MKKIYLMFFSAVAVFMLSISSAKALTNTVDNRQILYGKDDRQLIADIIKDGDNYVVIGNLDTSYNPSKHYIAIIDENNNIVKETFFSANSSITSPVIRKGKDGYYVGAYTKATDVISNHGSYDVILYKFDNNLEQQWVKNYGYEKSDQITSMELQSDGNIIISGFSQKSTTTEVDLDREETGFIMKIDSNGNLVKTAYFYAGNGAFRNRQFKVDKDDNIISYAYKHRSSVVDIYAIKYDKDLNIINEQFLVTAPSTCALSAAIIDSNGDYVFGILKNNQYPALTKYSGETGELIFTTEETEGFSTFLGYKNLAEIGDYYYSTYLNRVIVVDMQGNIVLNQKFLTTNDNFEKILVDGNKFKLYGYAKIDGLTNNYDILSYDLDIDCDLNSLIDGLGNVTISNKAKIGEKVEITTSLDDETIVDKYIVNGQEITGNNFTVTKDTDIKVVTKNKYTYTLIEQSERKFIGNDIIIRIDGNYNKFDKLYIDDVEIDPNNYTVNEGSTIIVLPKNYLNTLNNGIKSVRITYNNDKEVTTNIEIDKPMIVKEDIEENNVSSDTEIFDSSDVKDNIDNPKTFDGGIIKYIVLAVISILVVIKCCKRFKITR